MPMFDQHKALSACGFERAKLARADRSQSPTVHAGPVLEETRTIFAETPRDGVVIARLVDDELAFEARSPVRAGLMARTALRRRPL